ncbi:MAG TPA: OmpA family protein [Syntrophobacteria bacterium]|nr:OmpA family protein [Syntrophobacteria bacterium]
MRRMVRTWYMVGIMVALLTFMVGASAEAKLVPKTDNFVVLLDQSGSMYMQYEAMKQTRMAVAKTVLSQMNSQICELPYKGGLYLFAPFQPVLPLGVYDRAKFAAALQTVKNDQEIFGRLTPMELGINDLGAAVAGLQGKTVVILVTDGGANVGGDPVQAAKAIAAKASQVCFVVISVDPEGANGKRVNDEIAKINNCSTLVDARQLAGNQANMQKFVKDVFCEDVPEKAAAAPAPPPPPPPAAPAAAPVKKIVLRGINFDFDKANIKPEFTPVLDEGVDILKANPDVKVVVKGYTDSIGTAEYNQKLSERRAKSVLDYFVSKGIAKDRLSAVGYGMKDPIANNKTKDGRALNRRVELQVQ